MSEMSLTKSMIESMVDDMSKDIADGKVKSRHVLNSAGGRDYVVDDMIYFKRFLFLGTEKGTYYATKESLDADCAECIKRILEQNRGKEMLEFLKQVNAESRVAKPGPTLFALAYMAKLGDVTLRKQ